MPLWRLPDHFSDALPAEAKKLEALRRIAIDTLQAHGFLLVQPPLLEHLDALTTGTGQDLDALMFKTTDPASGKTLGLRVDATPQVARIDAHLLNDSGVTRLCYCVPAVRTQTDDAFAQREMLQVGAEVFGHAGAEADAEVQDLALSMLQALSVPAPLLALSHVAVARTVLTVHPKLVAAQAEMLAALRAKDTAAVDILCNTHDTSAKPVLLALLGAYGTAKDLAENTGLQNTLVQYPELRAALAELHDLAARASAQGHTVLIDLADLRGFNYHTGVQFAVYTAGSPSAILRGGRYDDVGAAYGRARPATGFSSDLRALARNLAE